MKKPTKLHRYTQIMRWAWNRYAQGGQVVLDRGGVPSPYSRIEKAAWKRYMAFPRDQNGRIVE